MTLPLAAGPATCSWCEPVLGRLLPDRRGLGGVARPWGADEARAGGRFLSPCPLPGWGRKAEGYLGREAELLRRHSWPEGTDPPSLLRKVTGTQSEKHPCFPANVFSRMYCYRTAEIIDSF